MAMAAGEAVDGLARTALVTGGTGGMGRVIAARLAADGFDVAVAYTGDVDLADAAVGEIKGHGRRGAAFAANIADEEAVSAALFEAVDDHFGHLDVVVHTAAINHPATLTDLDLADFDEIHRVNVRGTFVVDQQAARRVRDGGSIVNVSTSMVRVTPPALSAYTASKAAVDVLTRILAKELRGRDITVNAVAPGPTATAAFLNSTSPQEQEQLAALPPLGRLGKSRRHRRCRVIPGRPHRTVGQRPGDLRQRRPRVTRGNDHYDVLVVGSGPGGATTAARLAETGKRVLILERGDFLRRERDNWNSRAVFGDGKYTAEETFYDLHDRPFRPELHYYVGGNSKVYGAVLFRLLPSDFGEVQDPHGVAPAWPVSYHDMEPYYVRAEHLFWVHGQHGEDPFVGTSSRDYAYPPVQPEPRIQQLSDGLAKLGLHPFHLPLGVQLTQDAHDRATTDSRCIRCDRVDGFPCLLGAKADAEWAVVRPALAEYPNLTLMTRTTVERLLTDSSGGSITGVAVTLPDGSPHAFTADIVVLSAGAILSAVLLLKSANDKHPDGLANSSDMVDWNYMRHNNLALIAFSREPNPTIFQKTLALNDFYGPGEHWQYPMGNIQRLGKSDDWQIKAAAPRGLGWAPSAPYAEVAKHSIDFWLSSEDIPLADSRITLRPDGAVRH
jgi:NAD(P)-dependent dehydrogenase (short-subunit alcohol dehydrogenase family)/choline dehydrogenase-like flavoprotein